MGGVDIKSAFASKINWGELVKVLATLLALKGVDMPAEVQNNIVLAIVAIGGIYTWVMRTWFTTKLTVASLPAAAAIALALMPALMLAMMLAPARAADMPVKVPANAQNSFLGNGYPAGSSGFYFGAYTEGGGGSVNGSVPGVGSASLTTNSIDVGGTLGYAWGSKTSPVFLAVEGMFGWTNFDGSTQGLGLSGPASFEQRFKLGTPLSSVISLLPSLPNLGTVAPFPLLPAGVTASSPAQSYFMVGLHENDISSSFPGLTANREWRIAPSIGIGLMEQLSNNVAIDAWVETIFPDKSVCIGPVGSAACAGLGQQVKGGLALYY